MAEKSTKSKKAAATTEEPEVSDSKKYVVIVAIIIILIIFAGAIVYSLRVSKPAPASFSEFQKNFESANAIGVYASYTDNTSFSSTVACSTALIEAITGDSAMHKSPGQIHFFILNSTACTYSVLGPNATSYTSTVANCTAFSTTHPSIFINYSAYARTVITPNAIYVYGNSTSLAECGIASEIS
ncbi:MAG: hypothetical protein M1125_04505 [Candidatus Marsarchaeota archaeon]|nr:hypothetical protein [Candidatus Marsarchaeota archaeon]